MYIDYICIFVFFISISFQYHMNHHTGEKPYKCKYCDKTFATTGNLYTHKLRVHANGKRVEKREMKSREAQTVDEAQIMLTKVANKESKKLLKFQCQICKKCCGRQENYVVGAYVYFAYIKLTSTFRLFYPTVLQRSCSMLTFYGFLDGRYLFTISVAQSANARQKQEMLEFDSRGGTYVGMICKIYVLGLGVVVTWYL